MIATVARHGSYPDTTQPFPGAPPCAINFAAFSAIRHILQDKVHTTRGACSRFASCLMMHFPEIAERIDEADYGELHLEMGELKLATREAIEQEDWQTVDEHFTFVTWLLHDGGEMVADAIAVSYLGSLFYDEMSRPYAKARCLLPRPLSVLLEKTERHYEEMVS